LGLHSPGLEPISFFNTVFINTVFIKEFGLLPKF
jgi:hypothetical protein